MSQLHTPVPPPLIVAIPRYHSIQDGRMVAGISRDNMGKILIYYIACDIYYSTTSKNNRFPVMQVGIDNSCIRSLKLIIALTPNLRAEETIKTPKKY